MKITKELLKEKGACVDGYRAFLEEYPEKKFPDGVEYQELLDVCAEKSWEYGVWLLNKFGPTNEIREIEGDLIAEKSIIFAGQIQVSGGIEAGDGIEAGLGIEAGEGIEAGWSIEAGEGIKAGLDIEAGEGIKAGLGIKAGEEIEAGEGFGIYAGLCRKITDHKFRKIIAAERPENIMCGEFEEKKA